MVDDSKKILIAEDNLAISNVYKERLGALGYNVISASNGEDLIDMAKSEIPDLIMLEIALPKKNGFEALIELRADERLKRIPIFVISDEGSDDDIERVMQLGATLFFVKTKVHLVDIIQSIESALEEK
ncbi:MAG: response regulator [Patescibacteria group bacterium]